jgi:exopolysaccharide biosynthesis protein
MSKIIIALIISFPSIAFSQIIPVWKNVDSAYGPLPKGLHIYFTDTKIDTANFRAFYVIADLKNKKLDFTTDTSSGRRLTPTQFYNRDGQPVVVVNGSFFSFETNRNLNVVMKDKRLLSYNNHTITGRGKDTFTYRHPVISAIGIKKNGKADVAWLATDSSLRIPYATQYPVAHVRDSFARSPWYKSNFKSKGFKKWKYRTAMGGGPVLIQDGLISISNNEELKFGGKAINDKHPRTAMGYTQDNKLIILVVEGRNPNAGGATLTQLAEIFKDLGCVEALNLDGGGSSCLLVNGKETIRPSDKSQRQLPAVFIIRQR